MTIITNGARKLRNLCGGVLLIGLLTTATQAASTVNMSKGQTVYVPAYSHVYHGHGNHPFNLTATLRRFRKKNLPFQDVGAGLIKMSYLGNSGWRSNLSSIACIAALPSEMPFSYTLRLSSTTG